MPIDLPYMPSVQNVPAILDKIRTAGTPTKFTHDFLKATLGFSSSNDRAVIKILRQLGFISSDGTPTQRYNDYRGDARGKALAVGLREGWPDLFLSDEKIYEKSTSQIQSAAKSLTGAADSTAGKIATTFKAFADKADWSSEPIVENNPEDKTKDEGPDPEGPKVEDRSAIRSGLLTLHQDVHIHLPPTTDVSVYRAIFQALKAELM